MPSKTCKNCKNWVDCERVIPNLPEKYKLYKSCDLAIGIYSGPLNEYAHAFAFTLDSERLYSDLITSPDFGCILYDQKEGVLRTEEQKLAAKEYWDKAQALWPSIKKAGELLKQNPKDKELKGNFQDLYNQYSEFSNKAKEIDPNWQDDEQEFEE